MEGRQASKCTNTSYELEFLSKRKLGWCQKDQVQPGVPQVNSHVALDDDGVLELPQDEKAAKGTNGVTCWAHVIAKMMPQWSLGLSSVVVLPQR